MKIKSKGALTVLLTIGCSLSGYANILVNDNWTDGTRTDPNSAATPPYAENNGVVGTDTDADGNLESAWFKGGAGTLTAASGSITGSGMGASSASWYTYFTPSATPATLVNPGDSLHITWQFTPTGVNVGSTAQGFNLAVGLTPTASRVTADASIPSAAYKAYAMQMNMATVLGNANPFQLREWSLAGSGALLGTSGNYTTLAGGGVNGNTGYTSGTLYTFDMTFTLNASLGLDITASMSGGSLNNSGTESVSFTDTTPNTLSFDTFDVRPSSEAASATSIATSLFEVQFTPAPEPTSLALGGFGLLALMGYHRNNRRQ